MSVICHTFVYKTKICKIYKFFRVDNGTAGTNKNLKVSLSLNYSTHHAHVSEGTYVLRVGYSTRNWISLLVIVKKRVHQNISVIQRYDTFISIFLTSVAGCDARPSSRGNSTAVIWHLNTNNRTVQGPGVQNITRGNNTQQGGKKQVYCASKSQGERGGGSAHYLTFHVYEQPHWT